MKKKPMTFSLTVAINCNKELNMFNIFVFDGMILPTTGIQSLAFGFPVYMCPHAKYDWW